MTDSKFDIIAGFLERIVKHPQRIELPEYAKITGKNTEWLAQSFEECVGLTPQQFQQKCTGKPIPQKFHEDHIYENAGFQNSFISVESISPDVYKNQGTSFRITIEWFSTIYGQLLVGECARGICFAEFISNNETGLRQVLACWPAADVTLGEIEGRENVIRFLKTGRIKNLKLFLKGSSFQVQVWKALLNLREGDLSAYGQIAHQIGRPNASRAVGSAIGANNVALFIPCHRVIRQSGQLGGYKWGLVRKKVLLGVEIARDQRES